MSAVAFGETTRSLDSLWSEHFGDSVMIDESQILKIYRSLSLFPSKAQVAEMLHVASECSNRDKTKMLTFGEFCLYTKLLQKGYEKEIPRSPVLSKLSPDKNLERKRKISKLAPKYEVFLGGSCNPTTWRQDTAIPLLQDHGISFYNPQVAHWEEALVELEYQAKHTATVLFFVLDPLTRNVASMVESGYMAGCHRKLILVMDMYSGPGQLVNGDPMSKEEYFELTSGLLTVRDLLEQQKIPVFSDIKQALMCTVQILRENVHPQDLGVENQVTPVKFPYLPLGDKLIEVHDAFVNADSEKISLAQARVVYKTATNKELSSEELQAIVAQKKGISIADVNPNDLPLKEIFLTFDEFCCIVAEFEYQKQEHKRLKDKISPIILPVQRFFARALSKKSNRLISGSAEKDVYLGGSKESWREDIAIPMLRKHGLSFSPLMSSGRLLPMEATAIEKSRVLLFVISNTTRGVSAMTMLSASAIKDYNRGRSYLVDQANKDGVPVFDNVQEAVECVIQKCGSDR